MSKPIEASERGRRLISEIVASGESLGLDVVCEYPVPGGRIDVVWLWEADRPPLSELGPLPLVAFEVESSWRSRKHVKGSYLNLLDVGAALGVIVLAGSGSEIESLRSFAKKLVARPGSRVDIRSEDDVAALRQGRPLSTGDLPIEDCTAPELADADAGVVNPSAGKGVGGKHHVLAAWLRQQEVARLRLTFAEIEEILGHPLPPSARVHLPHWYSYQGSALARAIIDAGWKAQRADLQAERVTLVRQLETSEPSVRSGADRPSTCREEILQALQRLEERQGREVFDLWEIVQEVLWATDTYPETTIRTEIVSRMCHQAPVHHAASYSDLDRVGRGQYRRRR